MSNRGWFIGALSEIRRSRVLLITVAAILAASVTISLLLIDGLTDASSQSTLIIVTILVAMQLLAVAIALMAHRREIRKAVPIVDSDQSRQFEDEMMDSHSLLRALLDGLPQNVLCKDAKGRFVFGNRQFCQTLGRPLDEIVGKTDFDFFPAELAEKYVLDDQAVIKADKPMETVEEHVTPDGRKMYVRVVKSPMRDSEGNNAGLQGIFWDVTEEVEAEQQLQKERDLLDSLMDYSEDLIYFKDSESRFIRVNRYMLNKFGMKDQSEIVGKSDTDLFGAQHSGKALEDERKILRTGKPIIGIEEREDYQDKEDTWVSTTKMPLKNKDGEIIGVFGISRDITDKKRLEVALEQNLNSLLQAVSAVSEGDLTLRAETGDDTIGRVSSSINKMLESFSSMLVRVREIALSVSSCAAEILASSEQISHGSERQANEVLGTSSSVEQMAASMSQVSRNAEAAAEAVRLALGVAESGDRSVINTTEAMERISGTVEQTVGKMRLFAKRSSEISEIIDLIEGIASQTNLLALNAAIEAAHAGDAGLGFSVVAEEIRNLAERSAHAAKDIGRLVKAIQSETVEVLTAMEGGMKEVETGGSLARETRVALQNISQVVRQSADLIEEISHASYEQAKMTRDVSIAMQTISSIALESSAGAQETTQTIQGLVELSEDLNQAISRFRLGDALLHTAPK